MTDPITCEVCGKPVSPQKVEGSCGGVVDLCAECIKDYCPLPITCACGRMTCEMDDIGANWTDSRNGGTSSLGGGDTIYCGTCGEACEGEGTSIKRPSAETVANGEALDTFAALPAPRLARMTNALCQWRGDWVVAEVWDWQLGEPIGEGATPREAIPAAWDRAYLVAMGHADGSNDR